MRRTPGTRAPGEVHRLSSVENKRAGAADLDAYVRGLFGDAAELIAKGPNGRVYLVGGAGADAGLEALRGRLTSAVHGAAPARGSSFIVKVARVRGHQLRDAVHAARVHAQLGSACARMGCASRKVCGSTFVPALHVAGADRAAGVFVTAMAPVDGASLQSVFDRRGITAEVYAAAEKSVSSMWLLGVAHADMHMGNVLIDGAGKAWIVDFGFAVALPADLRRTLLREINRAPALTGSLANTVWYSKNMLHTYVNSVMARRRPARRNPDGKLLRALWNAMSDADRRRVGTLRSRAWGCRG